MHYLQLVLNDIYFSPAIYHLVAMAISTAKALWVKCFSPYANESEGWDSAMMAILFINPFLAFWADSFWVVWLQTLVLSLPLYFVGFYYRQYVLKIRYSDAAAGMMGNIFLYFFGHVASGAVVFILFLWRALWN
jgi:hypothetical protein